MEVGHLFSNSENFSCAKTTKEINSLKNIELHHAGLGNKEEKASIQIKDSETGKPLGGRSRFSDVESEFSETVFLKTIDTTVPEENFVSIIHLDVEGYEEEALTGALNTIGRDKPIIIVESTPSEEWMTKNLYPLGYRFERKILLNSIFVPQINPSS